jgi:hypothetical protein
MKGGDSWITSYESNERAGWGVTNDHKSVYSNYARDLL